MKLCSGCLGRFLVVLALSSSLLEKKVIAMQIPPMIKKTATLILVDREDGTTKYATGVFVGVKSLKSRDEIFAYFVTAKHAFLAPNAPLPTKATVLLNNKEGGRTQVTFPVTLDGKNKNIYFHKDPLVDLAVFNVDASAVKYDIVVINDDMFASKECLTNGSLREGADVFLVGMLGTYWGEERVLPICRFGKLALAADEKIPLDGVMRDLYLVEVTSVSGHSGGPVFFFLGPDAVPGELRVGNPTLLLAGINVGFINDFQPLFEEVVENGKTSYKVATSSAGNRLVMPANSGIAMVVPAYILHEIIFGDEMVAARRAVSTQEQP